MRAAVFIGALLLAVVASQAMRPEVVPTVLIQQVPEATSSDPLDALQPFKDRDTIATTDMRAFKHTNHVKVEIKPEQIVAQAPLTGAGAIAPTAAPAGAAAAPAAAAAPVVTTAPVATTAPVVTTVPVATTAPAATVPAAVPAAATTTAPAAAGAAATTVALPATGTAAAVATPTAVAAAPVAAAKAISPTNTKFIEEEQVVNVEVPAVKNKETRLPLARVFGEVPRTVLTNNQVDIVAKNIIRSMIKDRACGEGGCGWVKKCGGKICDAESSLDKIDENELVAPPGFVNRNAPADAATGAKLEVSIGSIN